MTIKELNTYFEEHLVPKKLYSLKGNHKNRICLEKNGDSYEVYFSDRKQKVGTISFASESAACLGMKNEIRKLMEQVYGLTFA